MKKVLIIEGGGAFGIIPAYFMSQLSGMPLTDIDCVSGCSIGGALAVAYASGFPSDGIFDTFYERMPECFQKRFSACVNPFACPTYSNKGLDSVLEDIVGDLCVGDIRHSYPKLDIFIPTLDLTNNKYKVFDNITGDDDGIPLADVAGYTTCAPSYYSGRDFFGKCMVDGGLIEVLPLLTTVTGLKHKRGVEFSDMDVLVLGCGERTDEKTFTTKQYNSLSLLGLCTDVIVPYVTLSNAIASKYWGEHMGLNSFTYYNPVKISGGMDDVAAMRTALGNAKEFRENFVNTWAQFLGERL